MNKIIDSEPAKYPITNTPELEAVTTFESIIYHKNVKPYINKNDKIPNYDGYLEITEDDQTPIGKIEVQIKKLSDDNITNPKCQCDKKFLSYCEGNILPTFLIAVDTINNIAYWLFVDRDLLKSLKIQGNSVNINIPIENKITKNTTDYLAKWKSVIKNYKFRIIVYDIHVTELKKLQKAYNILSTKSITILGSEKPEFEKIHRFLDKTNFLLETDFSIVKRIFYNSCWKLGFAYSGYSQNSVSYVLYPINFDKNDLQIKELSRSLIKGLNEEGLEFRSYNGVNPIEIRPVEHAKELISEYIKKIFKSKLLPIRHVSLYREIIFSFIDKFHECLGLRIKDRYSINEIKDSLNNYLPIWLEEAFKSQKKLLRGQYINIDYVNHPICKKDIDKLDKKIKERIKNNQLSTNDFLIGSEKYPINLIIEALTFLSLNHIVELERLYIPPTYDRLGRRPFIWSEYSSEDIRKNLNIFYKELAQVYDSVIEDFFPSLKSKLEFFANFDKLVVIVNYKEEDYESQPYIHSYYLKNKDKRETDIKIYMINDNIPNIDDFKSEVYISEQKYILISHDTNYKFPFYNNLPLLSEVYELLEKRFDVFLREM